MSTALITVTGNAVDRPELRFTSTGTPIARLQIASTERTKQNGRWIDGPTTYLSVLVGQAMAQHAAESVSKGVRVLVHGRLIQRDYETSDGDTRTSYELHADEIGVSLRYATVTSRRGRGSKPNRN